MNFADAFESDEPYEVLRGSPTLTFVIEDVEQALPYNGFAQGVYREGIIELHFSEGVLTIRGVHLRELWRCLQLQDVRSVQCKTCDCDDELSITAITWEPTDNEEDEIPY